MRKKKTGDEWKKTLRGRAQSLVRPPISKTKKLQKTELDKLNEELRIHQIELEMQNEELRRVGIDLESSRGEYVDLFDFAPVGYFTFDDKGIVQGANLTGANLLGAERKSLLKKKFESFILAEDQYLFRSHLQTILKTCARQTCQIRLMRKGGPVFYVQMECLPVLDDAQKVISIRAAVTDISSRKQAEEKLRESEKKYRQLIEQAADGIFMLDPAGIFVLANTRICEMLGYTKEEIYKLNIIDTYPDELKAAGRKRLARLNKGESLQFERPMKRKDGGIFQAEVNATKLDEGRIQAIVRDVTERKRVEEALRLTSYAVERSQSPIYWVGPDARLLFANDAACKDMQYTPEELQNMYVCDINPEIKKREWPALYQQYKRAKTTTIATMHRRKDGSLYPAEVTINFLDYEGKENFFVFVRDISERIQAEKGLKESEEKYRSLVENAAEAWYSADANGVLLTVNQAFAEKLGYSLSEIIGRNFAEFIDQADLPRVMGLFQNVLATRKKKLDLLEFLAKTKNGQIIYLMTRPTPIYLNDNLVGFQGIATDITERKKALEALTESERKFKGMFETSKDVIYICAVDGKIIDINEAAHALTGYPVDELKKMNMVELYANPEERPNFVKKLREQGFVGNYELRTKKKDGASRDILLTSTVIKDSAGKPIGFQGSAKDITERKLAEAKIKDQYSNLEGIIESSTSPIFSVDRNYCYTSFNKSHAAVMKALYGVEIKLGKNLLAYMSVEQDRSEAKANLDRSLRGESHIQSAYSGQEFLSRKYFEVLHNPIIDETGKVRGVAVFARDITERKRAEEALRESERRLSEAQKMAQLGHWIWDVRTGNVEWSEEIFRIFHLDPKEFTPQIDSIQALSPWPGDHERDQELIRRAMETHEKGTYEQRFLRPDQSIGYYYSTFQGQYDDGGNLIFIVGTVQDITERKRAEEALRERDLRFRKLSAQVPGMIYQFLKRLDGSYCVPFTTEAIKDIFGCSPQEVRDDFAPIAKVILPEDFDRVVGSIEYSAQHLTTWQCEYRVQIPGQSIRWMLGQATPEKLADGSVMWHGFNTDITERKRAEEQLSKSEEKFSKAFHSISNVIIISRLSDGKIIEVNDRWTDLFGYSREEVLGKSSIELGLFKDPRDREHCVELLPKQRSVRNFEIEILDKSGRVHNALLFVDPIEINNEPCMLTVIQDITERKRAEEALRRSEEQYRLLFDGVPVGISVNDMEGNIYSFNESLRKLLGYSAEELDKIKIQQIYAAPGERQKVLAILSQTGKASDFETRMRKKDGSEIAALLNLDNVEVQGRKLLLTTVRDITELKKAGEEKEKIQAELHQAQKMELVGNLAGGVAHDFNNILTIILSFSSLVLRDLPEESPVRADVEEIQTAAERAAGITQQLLAFSRKQIAEPQAISPNEVIAGATRMLARLIGENIRLELDLNKQAGWIFMDPAQVSQIIMNLAVNARDAMPGGGSLIIATEHCTLSPEYGKRFTDVSPGDYVKISVTDTGTGMNEEVLQKLFTPFFTTKARGKGTGLGLSVVYGIVKQNGGHIEVDSKPGEGTTFRIYLKALEKPQAGKKEDESLDQYKGKGQVVLLAEDEKAVRKTLVKILTRNGYQVVEAACGEEALGIFKQSPDKFAIVITDVVMPGMSGVQMGECMAEIKKDLKIIYCSGYTDEQAERQKLMDKSAHFLNKPMEIKTLLKKIQEVIGTSP